MNTLVYKYLPSVRIDVLRNLKIRISQPPVLNDPFENLQLFDLKPKNLAESIKKSGSTFLPSIQGHLFKTLSSRLNQATNAAIGAGFGIISFSRTELSQLLWSHYAEDYKGFVVGFDATSSFFASRIKGLERHLQDVIYTSKRREFDLDSMRIPNGFLCTKPVEWGYEEEIRFIDIIDEAEKTSSEQGPEFPIVLRKIPKEAIREIVVGPRSEIENDILKIVEANKLDATVYRLVLDEESYRLAKRRIG